MLEDELRTRELTEALAANEPILCVHYACGDIYATTDRPTPVSCIAVAVLGTNGGETSFSLANAPMDSDLENRERDLMKRFYDYLRSRPDSRIVHWNMNRASYGFEALGARYRYLFGVFPDFAPNTDRLFDLDALIEATYGASYVKHPKFRSLGTTNGLFMPFFKDGKQEANLLPAGDYGSIDRSTSSKAHMLAELATAYCMGTLKTQNSVGYLTFAGQQVDALRVLLSLSERTLLVSRSLTRRHSSRSTLTVSDEYDAQDLFRSLLYLFFEDIRSESCTPTYAGASARIDFVLPAYAMAVELKYVRPSLTAKVLGDELLVDSARYKADQRIQHLVCVVFDYDGGIDNPRGIEADLAFQHSADQLAVTVKILDR